MTRNEFLKASGAVGLLGFLPVPSFANMESNVLTIEDSKVTIRSVEPFLMPKQSALFIKVTSSEGIAGWGEANKKYARIILKMVELLGERIEGESIWDTEYLWNRMFFKEVDAGQNAFLGGAIAGIDNALWDLKGKLLNQPVYSLLGGPYVDKIQVYGSYGRGTNNPKSTKEMVEKAVDFVEKGYKAIKVRMQIRQLNRDPRPDPSFEVIREVRKAIGDDIVLFFDANNGYSPYRAIQVGRELYEKYNIASFEEPVAEHNYNGLAQVAAALDVPVTGGEHEFNRWQFRDLITIGKVDIINPDVFKAGGITEAVKIAALASAFDLQVMCHNTRPTLATAAAYHFAMSIHNAAEFQEYGGERRQEGLQQYFNRNLEYANGYIKVPDGPGLGLEPNEKKIRQDKIN
ncbi:MAG: mandelate racemase/muconate lactonizing enzyme family protein [Cyclobacteriaceae bacterium]|nr:mandelate racemase/muconate lactonizing enzyme family protein [Cyclobacteriaceae bacterium HetDA_MAG_MS6]